MPLDVWDSYGFLNFKAAKASLNSLVTVVDSTETCMKHVKNLEVLGTWMSSVLPKSYKPFPAPGQVTIHKIDH